MRNFYRRNKYGNHRSEFAGKSFASKLERDVYLFLLALGWKDYEIQQQDHVYLTKARILYIPDFKISRGDQTHWVEAKGYETPEWRMKLKLWKFYGPGVLHIYRRGSGKPEIICPEGYDA